MITTRNRAGELARTLSELQKLDPQPDELAICADDCSDESAAVVGRLAPLAQLVQHSRPKGSVASRNELARLLKADLIVSLDDDSYPLNADFISRIVRVFEADQDLAVVTFPQRSEEFPDSLQQQDFGGAELRGSYTSSGAVFRRKLFLELGGYPELFFHAYEEPDFALRCIAAGYKILFLPDLLVRHHFTAVGRNENRTHHFHARNEQWSIWMRCPSPWWIPLSVRRAAGQFVYACKRGPAWIVREPVWWWRALREFPAVWKQRRPVSWSAYKRWLKLLRNPEPVVCR